MTDPRVRHMSKLLAVAIAAASLIAALPGSMAAAEDPRACRVSNLDNGREHVNFQRAVWHAQPGDHLQVTGTCRGTATVRKPLRISGTRTARSGPARLIGKSGRPPLVIHPRVDQLTIGSSVAVIDGLVIDQPTAWAESSATIGGELSIGRVDEYVRGCGLGGSLASRVATATRGDKLRFIGTCRGPVHIGVDMTIDGDAWWASSAPIDHPEKAVSSSSGRPMIKRPGTRPSIIVDPSVERLVLQGFRLHDGLRIGEGVR